jgi:hypothetical protein
MTDPTGKDKSPSQSRPSRTSGGADPAIREMLSRLQAEAARPNRTTIKAMNDIRRACEEQVLPPPWMAEEPPAKTLTITGTDDRGRRIRVTIEEI